MKQLVLTILILGTFVARSGEAQGRSDKDWENNAYIYGLLASISGDARLGPIENPVDISFGDLVENLEGGFMGRYRGANERFSVVADFIYLKLGNDLDSEIAQRAEFDQTIFDITGGYRITPIFEAVFGMRVTDLSAEVQGRRPISGAEVRENASKTFYDPIFGARLATPLGDSDKWFLQAHGDIGGFGASMDLTWQVMANVGWKATDWLSIWGGYRALGQDFDDVGDREVFGADLTYYGPAFGVGFHF